MQGKCVREDKLKRLKHIVNALIWTLAGLYFALIILLHIPAVKEFIGQEASHVLAEKLGTKVEIGKIDLGFLNRLIIDDIVVYDQYGQKLLSSSRASVKIEILPLLEGRISVSSA